METAVDTIRFSLILLCTFVSCTLASEEAMAARAKPVYNIVDKPITTGSGQILELSQVGGVLAGAARAKGWAVIDVEPGYLKASIQVRQHFAAIDIRYTRETYSIYYRDIFRQNG